MKVYVWTGGHTIAESLVMNPPEGISVISNLQDYSKETGISGERVFVVPKETKQFLDNAAYRIGVPRFLPRVPIADLIHTVSGLVPITSRPWITTISMPSSFFGLRDEWPESRRRQLALRIALRSKNCKRVMCFSQSTLDGLKWALGASLNETIESKLEVLYPAVDSSQFVHRRKENEKFRILFVGNHFFDKGGRELHRAASRLAKKYDLELDIVTDAPPHHKKALEEYIRRHSETWTRWHVPRLARKVLIDEYYSKADVFVMCSYMEVFGYVFLEAMAAGLPIIGARSYAQREIISNDENGYLIDVPITPFVGNPPVRTPSSVMRYRESVLDESLFDGVVDQLTDRLQRLIEDRKTLIAMSKASTEMTSTGKFGLRAQQQQLRRAYSEALEK